MPMIIIVEKRLIEVLSIKKKQIPSNRPETEEKKKKTEAKTEKTEKWRDSDRFSRKKDFLPLLITQNRNPDSLPNQVGEIEARDWLEFLHSPERERKKKKKSQGSRCGHSLENGASSL